MKTIKTSKFVALSLFIVMIINLTPTTTNAAIFDWVSGGKTDNFKTRLIAFAGVGKDSGLSLLNKSGNSSSIQFLQSDAVVAANNPSSSSKVKKSENKTYIVPATAYSSTEDQTDDTPFITALGTHVHDGVIASNFLPFGTVIKIPELFGNKIFVVEDRMNSRYFYQIDIWFSTREASDNFGVKKVKIEVIS